MTEGDTDVDRRRVLLGTGSLLAVGLAGCSGGGDDGGNGGDDGGNGGDDGGNGGDDGGNGGNGGGNGDDGPTPTEDAVVIRVQATGFSPTLAEVEPGSVVRWEHTSGSGAHTVTFYHEDNDTQQRVPEGVEAVDESVSSGFHEVTLDTPGVYDYFCAQHVESNQEIGTLVVGENDDPDQPGLQEPSDEIGGFVQQELSGLNDEARDILGI